MRVVEASFAQRGQRGVDIVKRAVVGEPLEERHHLGEVVVGSRPAAGAVEDMGRDRVVPGVGEPPRDVLDVLVDAERLLDDDHRRLDRLIRLGLVDRHGPVGRLDLERGGLHGR